MKIQKIYVVMIHFFVLTLLSFSVQAQEPVKVSQKNQEKLQEKYFEHAKNIIRLKSEYHISQLEYQEYLRKSEASSDGAEDFIEAVNEAKKSIELEHLKFQEEVKDLLPEGQFHQWHQQRMMMMNSSMGMGPGMMKGKGMKGMKGKKMGQGMMMGGKGMMNGQGMMGQGMMMGPEMMKEMMSSGMMGGQGMMMGGKGMMGQGMMNGQGMQCQQSADGSIPNECPFSGARQNDAEHLKHHPKQ